MPRRTYVRGHFRNLSNDTPIDDEAITCPVCNGTGKQKIAPIAVIQGIEPEDCPECDGMGFIRG